MTQSIHVCHRCRKVQPPSTWCPDCEEILKVEPAEFLVGKRFGPYDLDGLVGTGAMGIVYSARAGPSAKRIAIKMMLPDAGDPTAVRRFLREARVLAELRHPNIIKVYDTDVSEWGPPYYVMEHLEGGTLRDAVTANPHGIPLEEVVEHARQIAAALEFAHARGVIHRDLKPENVLVTPHGTGTRDKVLDFGLARLVHEGDTRLTQTGIVLGTPTYMAPEQLTGREVGPKADQYALALIVAELLTGRKVRQDKSLAEIVTVEVSRPLPDHRLASCNPPPHVRDALIRATQPDPHKRFADVTEFSVALGARPGRWSLPTPRSRHWIRRLLIIALLAAAGGVAGVLVARYGLGG